MLKLDLSTVHSHRPLRDERLVLLSQPGEAPPEAILGRREFAVVPWIIVGATALALAIGEWFRNADGHRDWFVIGSALTGALTCTVLTLLQDRPIGVRMRRTLWVYVVGSAGVLASLAASAMHDRGVSSVAYAGVFPVAVYLGLVFPPRGRYWSLAGLFVMTAAVQIVNPATPLFDAAIVWSLMVSAWFAGVLIGMVPARTSRIARVLSSYDRISGALNRRGLLAQLDRTLADSGAADGPVALLIVDLVGFRAVNEAGDEAGDELLQWAGTTFRDVLPQAAELGRIGNDEFGVVLPGATHRQAEAVAHSIVVHLLERIDATVGVATSETRSVAAADLFRVAEAASVVCRREAAAVRVLVAGTIGPERAGPLSPAGLHHPAALSYASLRDTGKVPRTTPPGTLYRKLVTAGLLTVAAAGVVIIGRAALGPGHTIYDEILRYGGAPWLLGVVLLAVLSHRSKVIDDGGQDMVLLVASAVVIVAGVCAATLAAGGLTAPIGAALFVKTVFDASILPRNRSLISLGCVLGGWAVVAALSPTSMLWVVPYHLVLFGGSYTIGTLGYRAMSETGEYARTLSLTDDLTQLPGRRRFTHDAEAAFYTAATETGAPFGLLALQLHGLRGYNESRGYAAGDQLLREMALLLRRRFPNCHAIGRIGADEFVVAVPVGVAVELERLADSLASATAGLVATSVGFAGCPQDGASVTALLRAADASARERRAGLRLRHTGEGPAWGPDRASRRLVS